MASGGSVVLRLEAPTDADHRVIHADIDADGVLRRSIDFLAAFRLTAPLTVRMRTCGGRGGAWYYEQVLTVCYDYLATARALAAREDRPDWASPDGIRRGALADVVIHEGAHALFEAFRTPLLGREEDAADAFATYAILNLFGAEAPAMIRGIAFSYLNDAQARSFGDLPTLKPRWPVNRLYGGPHSTALQRMYTLVCLAYGFDEAAYADLVAMSDLPRWRRGGCADEYAQVAHAFDALLMPHLNRQRLPAGFGQKPQAATAAQPRGLSSR